MKFVDQLNVFGKVVFLRADLNVPLSDNGEIADDTRIRATLPTIQLLTKNGARVVVASHLGSPKGKRSEALSLKPTAAHLGKLLNAAVPLAADCIGPEVSAAVKQLKNGDVLLLENLRFHAEEEKNDPTFAAQLAELATVYVNDAFGTAHRAHASTAGMVAAFAEKAGGLTMKSEIEYFERAMGTPKRPLVAIFGGVKISTKMAALRHVGMKANRVIVGGAMANTLLAAQGYGLGKSLVEKEQIENARQIINMLIGRGCQLYLPSDFVAAEKLEAGAKTITCDVNRLPATMMALDIGPKSLEQFVMALEGAGTIVWNGPMGAFETKEFSAGTYGLIRALAQSPAITVVGGGDTDLALHETHNFEKMDYVSTGGGAFLELLEGKTLPAIAALDS